ncbi:hypothetical protein [Paenibacillus sp. NPDC057967]|uniref:hypothetical protein n=1 Tax=Paenibacillus sp. NPDC057967 TaxID=3346293 RepID=UPI0036DE081A
MEEDRYALQFTCVSFGIMGYLYLYVVNSWRFLYFGDGLVNNWSTTVNIQRVKLPVTLDKAYYLSPDLAGSNTHNLLLSPSVNSAK